MAPTSPTSKPKPDAKKPTEKTKASKDKKPSKDAAPSDPKTAPAAAKDSSKTAPPPPQTQELVKPKSLAEVEAQYKEGSTKQALVAVLKAVRPLGLSASDIITKAKELKIRQFEESDLAKIKVALTNDPNFCRVDRGVYSLHAFHPQIAVFTRAPAPKKRKAEDDGGPGPSTRTNTPASPSALKHISSLQTQAKGAAAAVLKQKVMLQRAKAALAAAKEAAAAEPKSPGSARRESGFHPSSLDLSQFELTEADKEYTGDPDDRKAMLEHRQKVQARGRELEKAKEAFIKSEQEKYEKEIAKGREKAAAMRKAERAVEAAEAALGAAEKVAEKAKKKLEAEGLTLEAPPTTTADKKKVAAEAAEPKRRYPLEDLEIDTFLKTPRPAVHAPSWLSAEESSRMASTLYVCDILSQFSRAIGIRPFSLPDFERALEAVSSAVPSAGNSQGGGASAVAASAGAPLYDLYQRILNLILEDLKGQGLASATERRWMSVLTAGTWPEVLRRYVLTRGNDKMPYNRPHEHAVLAASMISYDGSDGLTHDQHLVLLQYLADEVLQTSRLRNILQKREDDAADAKRDIRGDMAEERKRLKELAEAAKEAKKRRKLEAESKEAGSGTNEGTLQAPSGTFSLDAQFPEPSFDLPEELRKYKGNPKDPKAKEEFEKKQATERRRLEKVRKRWLGDRLRAERAEEARLKQVQEAEKAREAEREAAEEALAKAQEALEEKMEALALRRCAIGADRHHRQYWIFPKGAALYVEDESSKRWGVLSSLEDVDALMSSLDRRGVREAALIRALEKKYDGLVTAFKRAQSAGGRSKKWSVDEEWQREDLAQNGFLRQSGRDRRQAEFFDPGTGGTIVRTQSNKSLAGGSGACVVSDTVRQNAALAAFFGPSELTAFVEAVGLLRELRREVADADVEGPGPNGSWQDWVREVNAAGQGKMAGSDGVAETKAPNGAALCSVLQGKALELEGALAAAINVPDESDSESVEESDEEERGSSGDGGDVQGMSPGDATQDGEGTGSKEAGSMLDVVSPGFIPRKMSQEARALWRNNTERQKWITDLRQGSSATRLAYCLMVLQQNAEPLLSTLNKELRDRQAMYVVHKGGISGQHRPPLPPPQAGKKEAGKREHAEPEENVRATRARV